MNIGFTGTRRGMTEAQKLSFLDLLRILGVQRLHHGDCVGADDEAATMADNRKITVVSHPPVDTSHQAHNEFSVEVRGPKTHFARNRDIVDETDGLIATPCDSTRQNRGGTWYTVSYAEKRDKPFWIIWPDGTVEAKDGLNKKIVKIEKS